MLGYMSVSVVLVPTSSMNYGISDMRIVCSVCVCVRACVRACVREVRACVRACVRAYVVV